MLLPSLICAIALDNFQHCILADSQPQSDLPVRLSGGHQFKRMLLMAIGFDALPVIGFQLGLESGGKVMGVKLELFCQLRQ